MKTTTDELNINYTMSGTDTSGMDMWSHPEMVDVVKGIDFIDLVFIETSLYTIGTDFAPSSMRRVFKIRYSVKDGKWHESERMYGEIVPAQKEYFRFDDE